MNGGGTATGRSLCVTEIGSKTEQSAMRNKQAAEWLCNTDCYRPYIRLGHTNQRHAHAWRVLRRPYYRTFEVMVSTCHRVGQVDGHEAKSGHPAHAAVGMQNRWSCARACVRRVQCARPHARHKIVDPATRTKIRKLAK